MWLRTMFALLVLSAAGVMFSMQIYAAELKDPTRPYFFGKEVVEDSTPSDSGEDGSKPWILNSTFVSDTKRIAIINEKLVKKGDKIGNMRIIDIKPMKVLLRNEDTSVIVPLIQASVKVKAAKQADTISKNKVTDITGQ